MATRTSRLALMLVALAACATKTTSDTRGVASPEAEAPAQGVAAAPAASPGPASASGSTHSTPGRSGCAQNFAGFDADADGRVSREEFLARPHALPEPEGVFVERDGDADGALALTEFCASWGGGCGACMSGGPSMSGSSRGTAGPGTGVTRGPGMGMGPGRTGSPRAGAPRCQEHFTRFDSNGDGSVTEPELAAVPHPHGDAHEVLVARDQNHDGRLTQTEFCAPWNAPSTSSAPATP